MQDLCIQLFRQTTCEDADTGVGIYKTDDGDACYLQDPYVVGQSYVMMRPLRGAWRTVQLT